MDEQEDRRPHDPVTSPDHYRGKNGIECIEFSSFMPHCLGAAFEYIWRAGRKDPNKKLEDLKKARYFLLIEFARVDAIVWSRESLYRWGYIEDLDPPEIAEGDDVRGGFLGAIIKLVVSEKDTRWRVAFQSLLQDVNKEIKNLEADE